MSNNSSDLGAFLAGFVIGGLVGAATAIILAPQSGSDTRTQIAGRSHELRQMSNERLQQARQSAGVYTEDYRQKAGSAITNARGHAQNMTNQVQDQARVVLDSGKERAGQVRNQVGSMMNRSNGTSE
ncbi:MAG: YtxH domain-containing protein [Chloroflexota bacterium]